MLKKFSSCNLFQHVVKIRKHLIVLKKRSCSFHLSEDYVREKILFGNGKENFIKRVSNVKGRGGTAKNMAIKEAGILVPFCIDNGKLSLLYTIRSPTLSGYAGQVSFPGGGVDEKDVNVVDAALREAHEELGIQQSNVQIWTSAKSFPDRNQKYRVTPVIGYLGDFKINELVVNKEEVYDVFTLPLTHLLNPNMQGYTTYRNGLSMPVFLNQLRNIWGLTAIVTEQLLVSAFPQQYKLKFSSYRKGKSISKKHFA